MSKHQQGAVVIPIGSQKSSSSILLSSSLDETGGGLLESFVQTRAYQRFCTYRGFRSSKVALFYV
jgi:hypothetical protein